MFRIARVRIRWINKHEPVPGPAPVAAGRDGNPASVRASRAFHPLNLRVRLRWVGFGPIEAVSPTPAPRSTIENVRPAHARVLATLALGNVRMRVSWLGLGTLNRPLTWGTLLVVAFLLYSAYSAWTRTGEGNGTEPAMSPAQAEAAGLVTDDINWGGETIRLVHSPIDIGQAKDAFDSNLDTLMRGVDANPFVMDLELAQPQAVKGFTMDMGRMDFWIRVKVWGPDSSEPVLYQAEYRDQPGIPHVDMDFTSGPAQVKRIQIEIEQINPPEEVHVHVREIVLKK